MTSHQPRTTSVPPAVRAALRAVAVLLVLHIFLSGGVSAQNVKAPARGAVDRVCEGLSDAAVLAYGYSVASSSIALSATGDPSVVIQQHDAGAVDFTCLSGPSGPDASTWREIPVGVYGMVLVLNRNPPPASPVDLGLNPLLPPKLLAAIFNGSLTSWQDGALLPHDEFVDLPQGNISLVVRNYTSARAEAASYTGVLGRSLARYDPNGFGAAYAASGGRMAAALATLIPSARLVVIGPDTRAVSAIDAVMAHPGALAVLTDAERKAYTGPASPTTDFYDVDMVSAAGGLVSQPTPDSLRNALTYYAASLNVTAPQGLLADIGFAQTLTAWPLAGLLTVAIADDSTANACIYISTILKFLSWMHVNDDAGQIADASFATTGVASLTASMRQRASAALGLVRCGGNAALASRHLVGSGAQSTLWYWMASTYDPAAASFAVSFEPSANDAAFNSLATLDADFAGLLMGETQLGNTTQQRILPVGLRPLGCAANAGNGERLTLSLEVVTRILLGDIVLWNDSRLGAPASFGSGPIRVVLDQKGAPSLSGSPRGGYSNRALYSALAAAHPELLDGVVSPTDILVWPVSNRTTTLYGDDEPAKTIAATAGSFGCDFVDMLLYERALRIVEMRPVGASSSSERLDGPQTYRATAATAATASSLDDATSDAAQIARAAALTLARSTESLAVSALKTAYLAGAPPGCPDCWPMGAWIALGISGGDVTDCSRTTALLDWAWWIASESASGDDGAIPAATFGGDAGDAGAWARQLILATAANITCRGATVFSRAACLSNDNTALCSGHGTCNLVSSVAVETGGDNATTTTARCSCDAGWSGALCAQVSSNPSTTDDNAQTTVIIAVVLAVGLVCLCVLAVVAVLGGIAVASRARRGVWWWQEPRASWEIDLADLEIAELIGQGAMGKVYKAHYDDRLVAVKIVSETAMGARAFKEEIVTMMDFKHLNVMTPLCACVSGPRLALVMPFMELGSVYDLVHNEMLVVIPAGLRARMLFDVAKGMNYLHNAGIVHRDLKSPNLLVQKDWTVRITDFGLAMRVRAHRRAHALSEPEIEDVSTSWAAPEVLIDSNVATTEADVYSFGIIMWELLERAKPYGDAAQAAIAVAVSVHHRRPVLSPENQQTDDERLKKYIDLMRDCWSTEPEKRPTFAEVSTRIAVAYPAEEREGRSGRSSLLRGGAVSGGANDTATSRSLSDGASDVGSAHTLDGGGAGGDHDGARRHVRRAIESLYGAHDGDGARGHRGAGTNDNDDDDLASDTSTTTTDGEADPAATGAGVRTRRRGWRGKPLARPLEHGAAHLAAPLDRHNPLLLSPEDADDHSAVFVIADIAHNSDIWEADPYVARDATLLFLETARRLGRKHRATESKSPLASSLGTICLAFRGAPAAVGWASALQQELLRVAWDDKLLRIDAAGEVAHGMDDRIIYKGLRVRMGIETGEYRRIDGDMPGAVRFTGPALVRAASACTMADGGQILMGRTCYTAWASGLLRAGRSLFSLRQPQALEPHYIEVVPAGLEERYFGESRPIDIDGDTAPSRVKSERNDHSDSDSDLDSSVSSVSTALDDPPTRVGSDPLAQLSATRGLRWLLQFNDSVELQDELGVGSYGVVYRARWNHQHPAAFKRLLRQVASEVNLLNFIADAGVLFLLEPHPNIVVQLGACIEPPNMGVLTGLSDRGPLSTVLYDVKHRLRFKTKVAMLADVARGLAFLHEHDIVHRHVSPHNLLVDADWRVRISDAGFHQARSEGAMATRCGAPLWTPPELFMMSGQLGAPEDRDDENAAGDGDDGDNRAPHTLPASRRDKPRSRASASDLLKRIDIYALGIVMWEVYMRRQPYQGKPAMELALQIPKGLRPDVPSRCPEVYADLMTRCWSSDPAARPSSSDALHALEAIVHSLPAGQTWDPTDDSELSV